MSKIKRKHSPDLVNAALDSIRGKRLSIRKASKMYGIPLTTLHNKLTGRLPVEPHAHTLLTIAEEDKIAEWIAESTERGLGKTGHEVRHIAKQVLDRRNGSSKSKTRMPTTSWLYKFCKRHPELTLRSPRSPGKQSLVNGLSLEKWFRNYKCCIDNLDPMLLNDPLRIYNVIEIGFSFDANSREVDECWGLAHVHNVKTDVKPQVTVLACTSAGGHFLGPLIIYPNKEMSSESHLEHFPEAVLQVSDDGWITAHIFNSWLRDIFIPATGNVQKPLVLLVNSHSTSTTLVDTSQLCHDNQIVLHDLLPNAGHLIQPLGQEFFDTFKLAWSDARKHHICEFVDGVDLESFAKVLKPVWVNSTTPTIAAQSFKAAGFLPFDPDRIIQSSKLGSSTVFLPESLEVQNVIRPNDSNNIPPNVTSTRTSLNEAKNSANDILLDTEIKPISSDIIPKCEIESVDNEIQPITDMQSTFNEIQPISDIQLIFEENKPILEMQPIFSEDQLNVESKPIVSEIQPNIEIHASINEIQPINSVPPVLNITSNYVNDSTLYNTIDDHSPPSTSSSLLASSNPDLSAAQLKALQEYSYFLFDEMGRNHFTQYFGKLTDTVQKVFSWDEEKRFNIFKKLTARLFEPCVVEEPKNVQVKVSLDTGDIRKTPVLVGMLNNKQRALHIQTSTNLVSKGKLREALMKKTAEKVENNKLKKNTEMEDGRKKKEEKKEALQRKEGKKKKEKQPMVKEELKNRLKRNGPRKAKKVTLVNADSLEDSGLLQTMELDMAVEDGDN